MSADLRIEAPTDAQLAYIFSGAELPDGHEPAPGYLA